MRFNNNASAFTLITIGVAISITGFSSLQQLHNFNVIKTKYIDSISYVIGMFAGFGSIVTGALLLKN
jgi:hypothetical protein